ncbi:C3HC zinc finger-like-domain-containing protein [Cyathus striatus]|nr:C3HC zinc finger-like-domain-containing protein [Cyathus striatus]
MTSSSVAHVTDTNIRTTKRKLAVAFEDLDNAVTPQKLDRPPPSKRTNTTRSLYSTLAKYGIKSRESHEQPSNRNSIAGLSKSTPHLSAILNRAATRTKKAFPFRFSTPSSSSTLHPPPTTEYRPSSLPSFLARLSTFKLSTYSNKPSAIDAVSAAKCGWTNDGKDRLVCAICHASWVVVGREGMSRDAGNALIEKQRLALISTHKEGCPWKTRQCDASIYCIPLQAPAVMVKVLKATARILDPVLHNVAIKHPLSFTQVQSLHSSLSELDVSVGSDTRETNEESNFTAEPSDSAILVSLFGWSLVPPTAPEPLRRSSTTSRLASAVGSRSATPSLTHASAVSRGETPSPQKPFIFKLSPNLFDKKGNNMLQCTLCQRRIGLWAFISHPDKEVQSSDIEASVHPTFPDIPKPEPTRKQRISQRQFDLLKEHRSYCPYVVRSTVIPSLNSSSDAIAYLDGSDTQLHGGAMEGWKAVLIVILRHGVAQRQSAEYQYRTGSTDQMNTAEPMDVYGVKSMMDGVKSHGGKDLLKYVKGLLS